MKRSSPGRFTKIFPWVVLVHVVFLTAFWLTNRMFYSSTNDYLEGMIGKQIDYISLVLWLTVLIGTWCIARIIISSFKKIHPLAKVTAWLFAVSSIVFILFFYGSFWMLFREAPIQPYRLLQMVQYFRILPDTILLVGLTLLGGWWLRKNRQKADIEAGKKRILPAALILLGAAVLWLAPLFFQPGNIQRGDLPEKPKITAHRGAAALAPENTIIAAETAADLGVYTLETDIHLSQDGEPFILHDDTLERTTNVAAIYPGRENDRAETFTLAEVTSLNAGAWFTLQDPFFSISQGRVSQARLAEYQQQTVPTLDDLLKIVRERKLHFIFDLKQPPAGHPYAASFFEITLQKIHQAGIDPYVWFLITPEQIQELKQAAPEMIPAFGESYKSPVPTEQLVSQGYQVVNVEYGLDNRWIREYRQSGLWVNVYVVDETWEFSRLWLAGANSVTTNDSGVMVALQKPVFNISEGFYQTIWSMIGAACAAFIIARAYPFFSTGKAGFTKSLK